MGVPLVELVRWHSGVVRSHLPGLLGLELLGRDSGAGQVEAPLVLGLMTLVRSCKVVCGCGWFIGCAGLEDAWEKLHCKLRLPAACACLVAS